MAPPEPPVVRGPPTALRWVLARGVPVEIRVTGTSMEPTLPVGTRVTVVAVEEGTELHAGDVAVIATDDPNVFVVHRLMHLFLEGSTPMVVHQGDAPHAAFALVPRDKVVARVTGAAGSSATGVPSLHPADGRRFAQRRLACRAYVLARRLATAAGLERSPALRRCGALVRRLAGRLTR